MQLAPHQEYSIYGSCPCLIARFGRHLSKRNEHEKERREEEEKKKKEEEERRAELEKTRRK
jgi:hypothetical protein